MSKNMEGGGGGNMEPRYQIMLFEISKQKLEKFLIVIRLIYCFL